MGSQALDSDRSHLGWAAARAEYVATLRVTVNLIETVSDPEINPRGSFADRQ